MRRLASGLFLPARHLLFTTLALGLQFGASARAETVVFSNLTGPCCGGLGVEGSSYGFSPLGEEFTPSETVQLTAVEVVAFQMMGFGGDPYFNLGIFSNSGGVPGTLIDQVGTRLVAPDSALGGIVVADSELMPDLMAGDLYWLVLTPADASSQIGWEYGGSEPLPFAANAGWGWMRAGSADLQFEVEGVPPPETGDPTPEPGTLTLVITALGTMVCRGVLRQSARGEP